MRSPSTIHVIGRLNHSGVVAHSWRAIAWAISIGGMSLHSVNEYPIDIIHVAFKLIPCRYVLLPIVVRLERSTKAQARDRTIDKNHRL